MLGELRTRFEQFVTEKDEARLRGMVREGLARGRAYGLTWESSLGIFVILSVTVGPDFDQKPRVRQILLDESRPPNERVKRLIRPD
jgi:hypothetical protein